jgi:hypothetical protein
MAVKLAHGVKNGKVVRIFEVANGLSCGCICPNPKCGAQLIAVQGSEVAWHFRHYIECHNGRMEHECAGAVETAIHLLAKDFLSEKLEQTLPARTVTVRRHNFEEIKQEHKKFRDHVVQEQIVVVFDYMHSENDYATFASTDGSIIKPDVIAAKGDMEIYFEILVTHAVDDVKRERIRKLGKSCIEIDLRCVDRNISMDALRKEVHDPKNRRWVCHRKDDDFLRQARAAEDQKGRFYQQKRAEEEKNKAELARIRREQEEKNRNIANYREFEADFFEEILSTNYPWRRGFADQRIQRFIGSEAIESEVSTVLNRYDSNASVDWYSEDDEGIEWEISFCGERFYARSCYSHDRLKCIEDALFDFLLSLLSQGVIEEVNSRETKIREEEEKRRIEQEEYLKKLEKEKELREQEEKERQRIELERQKRESERVAAIRQEEEKRARQKHEDNKAKFMDSYIELLRLKSIKSPWNKTITPSEIKAKCGFDDSFFIRLRKELQAEKKLKPVPENKLLTSNL